MDCFVSMDEVFYSLRHCVIDAMLYLEEDYRRSTDDEREVIKKDYSLLVSCLDMCKQYLQYSKDLPF